jgi:hypothetical protein
MTDPKVFRYIPRRYVVRPGENLTGVELTMTGLTLDEGAGFEGLGGPALRTLLLGHVSEHNLDIELGALDLADVRLIFLTLGTAMREAAVPPASAAS